MSTVAVIGGGAAGMMAAVAAAEAGHKVSLYEKNEKLGKKLYITGKGRCNVTNNCTVEELLEAVCVNRKFLYSAFYGFDSQSVMRFFEETGLPLKTERGNRVFPVSDHSSDVIAALAKRLRQSGVRIYLNTEVAEVLVEGSAAKGPDQSREAGNASDGQNQDREAGNALEQANQGRICGEATEQVNQGRICGKAPDQKQRVADSAPACVRGLRLADGSTVAADVVIVATGGVSYRTTGSTGDGHRFAKSCGHTVTELSPSLVPVETEGEWAQRLQGLSLRNVGVRILDGRKELYRAFGEMMFTHFGVTGPLILTASSVIQKRLAAHPLELLIDLKPALDEQQLDARILREFEAAKNKQFKNALSALYPSKLIPVMIERSEIPPEQAVHDISRAQRERLVQLTKHFPLTLTRLRGYNEAIITRGGVSVKQVNPATMESRVVRGLRFAGEVLDLDAVTGGFNLQIAWSTGYAAGSTVE